MDESKERLEQLNLKPIDRKVLNNYFWSFHHSQGNPINQSLISIYVARLYNKDDIGPIDALNVRLQPTIKKMQVPTKHVREAIDPTTGEKRVYTKEDFQNSDAGFRYSWSSLMTVFNRVFSGNPKPWDIHWMGSSEGQIYKYSELSNDVLLSQIASHMLDADLKYQEKERPNRQGETDIHSSHIEMYIFNRIPTQSPEYDSLYKDIGKLLTREDVITDPLRNKFERLATEWEKNHPGRKFIPLTPI